MVGSLSRPTRVSSGTMCSYYIRSLTTIYDGTKNYKKPGLSLLSILSNNFKFCVDVIHLVGDFVF